MVFSPCDLRRANVPALTLEIKFTGTDAREQLYRRHTTSNQIALLHTSLHSRITLTPNAQRHTSYTTTSLDHARTTKKHPCYAALQCSPHMQMPLHQSICGDNASLLPSTLLGSTPLRTACTTFDTHTLH